MTAAERLQGLELMGGWRVISHIARSPSGTGGIFSESYEVSNGERSGFLKAFDFSRAFEPGNDTTTLLQLLVECYNHERAVLNICKDRRMQNVVIALDHGEVNVPGMGSIEGRVYYLIFELADGDVRVQMDISKACGTFWCLQALRDVTLGLFQIHKETIAHQDVKPSNVLTYEKNKFKVADFGRSSRRGYSAPHDSMKVPGDKTYAPPELLYGYTDANFAPRRLGCDLYMLGNLVAFLFTGVNVTALMMGKLDRAHHHTQWGGTYHDVLPYLQSA